MAKFYGSIGYADTTTSETQPGVWVDDITERTYTGDVITNSRKWKFSGNVNPDITISDVISIIADGFIIESTQLMKYVSWRGVRWEIVNIEIERPRVILTLGGVYSGRPSSSSGGSTS